MSRYASRPAKPRPWSLALSDPVRTLTLDDQLCFSLYGASMAINRAYKPLLDALEITYPQYLALGVLWEADGQTIGAIAEKLGLDSSNVTPLVKRMEAGRLVTRVRNPADERQVVVRLTDLGRDMQARSACLGETLFASAGLSVEKLVQLNKDVQAFRDSVARFVVDRPHN